MNGAWLGVIADIIEMRREMRREMRVGGVQKGGHLEGRE